MLKKFKSSLLAKKLFVNLSIIIVIIVALSVISFYFSSQLIEEEVVFRLVDIAEFIEKEITLAQESIEDQINITSKQKVISNTLQGIEVFEFPLF